MAIVYPIEQNPNLLSTESGTLELTQDYISLDETAALLAEEYYAVVNPGEIVELSFVATPDIAAVVQLYGLTPDRGGIEIALRDSAIPANYDIITTELSTYIIVMDTTDRDRLRLTNRSTGGLGIKAYVGVAVRDTRPSLPVTGGGGGGAVTITNWEDFIVAVNKSYVKTDVVGPIVTRIVGEDPPYPP